MASELDGRDVLLRNLDLFGTRLTRDLFYNLDHPDFDKRESFTTLIQSSRIGSRCAIYADSFSDVLSQLAKEIRIAIKLLNYQDWNDDILGDALKTLHYQIYDFFGPIAQFLWSQCNRNPEKQYKGRGQRESSLTFDAASKLLKTSFVEAELAFHAFLHHLVSGKESYLKPDHLTSDMMISEFRTLAADRAVHKIPTATFTELVIQNMVVKDWKPIQNADPAHATRCITDILKKQRDGRRDGGYSIRDTTGIPRCLVIVFDKQTGIVTTGATQPAYHSDDFPWLDKVGKQIHGLRIGATFRHAVHLCSENVAQLINDGQTRGIEDLDDSCANSIYDNFMKATKDDKLSTLPQCGPPDLVALRWLRRKGGTYEIIPGPEGDIFSWAIDTSKFELKPPCLRCQRMFSGWVLHDAPTTTESRKTALKNMFSRALSYNKKTDTCSYCAETATAAKLYLLRHGKLALS